MVTSGTYKKIHHFYSPERKDFLQENLLLLACNYGWQLSAWAVFSNHYHFIAQSPENPKGLHAFIKNLHVVTARYVNNLDNTENRCVWYEYRDTLLTYQNSFLARLNYVNQNPVRHGIVQIATEYPWCSASWFKLTAPTSLYKTVSNFKIDKVKVIDDF